MLKRFAVLQFDRSVRKTYLLTFVRAENAPHAQLLAYEQFGPRRDLFTRSTTGKASYKTAPGYAGRKPITRAATKAAGEGR